MHDNLNGRPGELLQKYQKTLPTAGDESTILKG
jgi:hypothetical protein